MNIELFADRLAERLALIGLRGGTTRFDLEEPGLRYRRLARWPVGPGVSIEIAIYSARFFGTHLCWVGFGSSRPGTVDTLVNSVKRSYYHNLVGANWTTDFRLASRHQMTALRRASFIAYEINQARRNWAWFGHYLRLGAGDEDKAMEFLRTVINLHTPNSPGTPASDGPTETVALRKARLKQEAFRDALFARWGRRCALTGCDIAPVLEAAHINSWATHEAKRLAPDNGLLLVSTVHRLFDRGLLTFDDDGKLRIKDMIDRTELARIGVREGMRLLKPLTTKERRQLSIHRRRSERISYASVLG